MQFPARRLTGNCLLRLKASDLTPSVFLFPISRRPFPFSLWLFSSCTYVIAHSAARSSLALQTPSFLLSLSIFPPISAPRCIINYSGFFFFFSSFFARNLWLKRDQRDPSGSSCYTWVSRLRTRSLLESRFLPHGSRQTQNALCSMFYLLSLNISAVSPPSLCSKLHIKHLTLAIKSWHSWIITVKYCNKMCLDGVIVGGLSLNEVCGVVWPQLFIVKTLEL